VRHLYDEQHQARTHPQYLAQSFRTTVYMATDGDARGGNEAAVGARSTRGGGPMKPSFLELPGEPPVKWTVWVAMFRDHLLAYDLDQVPEARKLAILRTSLGAEGYRICLDLCPEEDVAYDEVLTRLGNRFSPKVSRIYARSVFHRRVQLSDESCLQFSAHLGHC
jgi:hypothetical protein